MTVDILLDGFLTGGVYALAALGFVMVFKSSQILNLAYGQMIAISAYVLYWLLTTVGVPTWLGILLLFAFGAALGFLIERLAIRPLLGQSFLMLLMMTLMLGFLFHGIIVLIWGVESFHMPFTPTGMLTIGDWQVSPATTWGFVVCVGVFLLLTLVFRYTKIGLAMRVVAADHAVAQSLGIRVRRIFSLSWVMSGFLAAIVGILVGMVWMVTPDLGDIVLGKGLPVLILGGLDSVPGALVGGLIIGLVEPLGGYWAPAMREVVPWIVMLVILLVRPYGLFGQRDIERI
ncbi:MAG TPA: branched-chain amino acid ABC transporter permease [Dehalococcoidia bacterium]|jgi:branched-chain amino acid transport system permease protein|nr:branched-chain amino acid ABC transporter permease [Dehalococcoidia bacterium]